MTLFLVAAAAMLALSLLFALRPLLAGAAPARPRWQAGALGLALALLACVLYAALGTPNALLAQPPAPNPVAPAGEIGPARIGPGRIGPARIGPGRIGPAQIEAMVQRLADRLKTQPDDAEGWRRLARSYETLRRFEQAAEAYRQLLRLEPDNLDAAVDHAVVLGMTLGGKLAGPPEQQLLDVLRRDPKHLQALALAGSAALERGDKTAAAAHWRKILAVAPKDSPIHATVRENLAKLE